MRGILALLIASFVVAVLTAIYDDKHISEVSPTRRMLFTLMMLICIFCTCILMVWSFTRWVEKW